MSNSLRGACKNLLDTVSERVATGGVPTVGISTGMYKLDDVLGGWRKKALYIIAGRPGMGKSSLGLWTAIAAALNGETVMLVSLEMSDEMIALRTLSGLTGISAYAIERGLLNAEQFGELSRALKLVDEMKFTIIDTPLRSEELVEKVEKVHEKHPLGLVVVDYASLLRDENRFGDNERLGRVSNNMLAMSMNLSLPVLLLAQLNREVEKRENHMPILSDIRDSGSLEQDAFAVIFTYRPAYYRQMFEGEAPQSDEKDALLIIAKNRQGETGQMQATFYPQLMKWTQVKPIITNPPATGQGRKKHETGIA